jgi:hypothetical protein
MKLSLWQIPQAATLMRTAPAPGSVNALSVTVKSAPGPCITMDFIGLFFLH